MQYLVLDDFYKVINEDELIDVVGAHDTPADEGSIILEALETDGIQEMTGYLDIRYDADSCFDPNDPIAIIKMKLVDIILYHAYTKISPNNVPEHRFQRYENAIDWLDKVASGKIAPKLPIKDEEDGPTTPIRFGSTKPKEDQYF